MPTVTPPWTYSLQLPRDPCAPGIARTTLRAVLAAHSLADLTPTAELLAAELLANAHLHTTGDYGIRLRAAHGGGLRISVWDSDPRVTPGFVPAGGVSLAVPPDGDAENGRGLHLVRACAESMGGAGLGGGKLLWAECQGGEVP
ncbi:ATP-binding protein [Streptomyces sp. NPDC058914]|uniref:ATP-binding protein n=1 Tax=Streptomyces sp. NPDC058914 TaxID=3346671 RepID=UPI0036991B69